MKDVVGLTSVVQSKHGRFTKLLYIFQYFNLCTFSSITSSLLSYFSPITTSVPFAKFKCDSMMAWIRVTLLPTTTTSLCTGVRARTGRTPAVTSSPTAPSVTGSTAGPVRRDVRQPSLQQRYQTRSVQSSHYHVTQITAQYGTVQYSYSTVNIMSCHPDHSTV